MYLFLLPRFKIRGYFVSGCYVCFVYHYNGSGNIPTSGAKVKIYVRDRFVKVYTPPPAGGLLVGEE